MDWIGLNYINLSVFEVEFLVVFVYFAKDAAGISNCHNIGWNIFRDNTSGTDYNIISNCDTGHDEDTGTEPAISSNVNGNVILVCLFHEAPGESDDLQ